MSGHVLIVVACAAAKCAQPTAAAKLYSSNHFAFMLTAARSEAVETTRVCGQAADVAILSALHGLVDPESVIAPYDLKMGQPGSCSATQVAEQLSARRPSEIIAMLLGGLSEGALRRHSHRQRDGPCGHHPDGCLRSRTGNWLPARRGSILATNSGTPRHYAGAP